MRMRVQLGCGGSWWSTRRGAAGYSSIVSGAPSLPHPPPGMEVCSLPLLQQLSLKGRELDACCSDEDCEQVFKARRYSGIYSPSKAATAEPEAAAPLPAWSPAQSAALYNVPGWGDEFFKASDDGRMLVAPQGGKRPLPPPASRLLHARRSAALPATHPGCAVAVL